MTNYEFASGMLKDFGDVTEEYLESYYGMKGIFVLPPRENDLKLMELPVRE